MWRYIFIPPVFSPSLLSLALGFSMVMSGIFALLLSLFGWLTWHLHRSRH